MTTKLDTRPARCDLTSRECCKLLCGALAGAIAAGLKADTMRRIFSVMWIVGDIARTKRVASEEDQQKMAGALAGKYDLVESLHLTAASAMLSAVAGAISEQATPGALETAFDWVHEQGDDFWEQLALGGPPAVQGGA